MKSILKIVDLILGRVIKGMMGIIFYLVLIVLTLSSLITVPLSFFEYDAGLEEIDIQEIFIFSILIITIWRFFHHCKKLAWTRWRTIQRFIFIVPWAALLAILAQSTTLVLELINKGRLDVSYFYRYDEIWVLIFNLTVILSIYAATPLPKKNKEHRLKGDSEQTATSATEITTPKLLNEEILVTENDNTPLTNESVAFATHTIAEGKE